MRESPPIENSQLGGQIDRLITDPGCAKHLCRTTSLVQFHTVMEQSSPPNATDSPSTSTSDSNGYLPTYFLVSRSNSKFSEIFHTLTVASQLLLAMCWLSLRKMTAVICLAWPLQPCRICRVSLFQILMSCCSSRGTTMRKAGAATMKWTEVQCGQKDRSLVVSSSCSSPHPLASSKTNTFESLLPTYSLLSNTYTQLTSFTLPSRTPRKFVDSCSNIFVLIIYVICSRLYPKIDEFILSIISTSAWAICQIALPSLISQLQIRLTDLIMKSSLQRTAENPYMRVSAGPSTFRPLDYRSSVEEDVRLSFAADLNPLVQWEGQHHWRSFVATLIHFIGLVVSLLIWYFAPENFTQAVAIAIPITAYVLYLFIGCICNDIHEYLRNIQPGESFEMEYDRVQGLIGSFDFSCECYHYETRYHVRHHTHNGETRIETYTTQVKVVTHTAAESVTPAYTTDQSGQVDRIQFDKDIIFIHFIVNYRFQDDFSRNRVDELFDNFKRRNTFDAYQNFRMAYNVRGLVEKMAFYVGDLGCNYNCWYYVFALLGLLWPYSLWVESKINRFEVAFMKVIKM